MAARRAERAGRRPPIDRYNHYISDRTFYKTTVSPPHCIGLQYMGQFRPIATRVSPIGRASKQRGELVREIRGCKEADQKNLEHSLIGRVKYASVCCV